MVSDYSEEADGNDDRNGREDAVIEGSNEYESLNRRSVLRVAGLAAAAGGLGVTSTDGTRAQTSDPDVDVAIGFDDGSYLDQFSQAYRSDRNDIVDGPSGGALSVGFPGGDHWGTDMRYRFAEEGHDEPETLHYQYDVYFPTDFEVVENGGKLPGPAGTYDTAGWGGRHADGTNGWSARMSFTPGSDADHVQVGWYCYHADMGTWGSNWAWTVDGAGDVTKGEWHRIAGEVTMNTPGEHDGVLRGWVDGDLAFEKTDLRFRDTTDLKIQDFWFNAYYGGSWSSPSDNEVRFGDLQLSTQPIDGADAEGNGSSTPTDDARLVAFVSTEDSASVMYDFTAGGPVEFTTAPYDSPSGKTIQGGTWSSVDYVEQDGDTWRAGGGTGEGYGDAFLVDGPVLDVSLDAPDDTWIELDGETVTATQLVEHTAEGDGTDGSGDGEDGTDDGSGDGTDETDGSGDGGAVTKTLVVDGSATTDICYYRFRVSGEIERAPDLTDVEGDTSWDALSDSVEGDTVVGLVGNGADGYRFTGDITDQQVDGDADIRVEVEE